MKHGDFPWLCGCLLDGKFLTHALCTQWYSIRTTKNTNTTDDKTTSNIAAAATATDNMVIYIYLHSCIIGILSIHGIQDVSSNTCIVYTSVYVHLLCVLSMHIISCIVRVYI